MKGNNKKNEGGNNGETSVRERQPEKRHKIIASIETSQECHAIKTHNISWKDMDLRETGKVFKSNKD